MIEINLLPDKKAYGLPVILGLDLNKVNLKMVLISLFFLWFVPGLVKDFWISNLESISNETLLLSKELKKLKSETGKNDDLKKVINKLSIQEKVLKERLEIVKKIIRIKKNPTQVLLYVSKNIPDDLWITSIELNSDAITLKGESTAYRSIGLFIENLKNSVFFDKSLRLLNSQTLKDEESGKRTEQFELAGTIINYN